MTPSVRLPRLAITMGDAAGIGPEVIVRAWVDGGIHRYCRPLAVGSADVFCRQAAATEIALDVAETSSADAAI